jgi:signal transduction histidine kinase
MFQHRKIVVSLALALATAMVLIGGISFQRKLETFQSAGIELRASAAGGIYVSGVDLAIHPELRTGDQILLVGANTTHSVADTLEALRRTPNTEVVVLRGDEAITLPFDRAPLAIDYSYLPQAFIGALYLLIGLFTILREQSRQSRVFYLWCLASCAFYLLVSTPLAQLTLDATGQAIYVLEEMARVLLPALTLHFFVIFPRDLGRKPTAQRLIPALYLPSLFLLALQADLIFNRGRALLGAPRGEAMARISQGLDRIELFLLVGFAVTAAAILLFRLGSEEKREERRRLLWIALGMGAGYLPFLMLYLVPWSLGMIGPPALDVIAVLPLALVPLTFAYAILRYRLWDITVIARDVATYTLTLLFGLLGFSVLQMLVQRGVPEGQELTRNLLSVAAVLVVGGLLAPARQGISSTLERVQYRQSFGKRRTLRRLGRDLLHDRDLKDLSGKLLDNLQEALGLERSNLLLCERDDLEPLIEERDELGPLTADFLGDGFWAEEHRRISGVALPDAVASTAQRLFVEGYRYAFPLSVRGRRVGALVTGHRYGDMPLSSDDLDLVRQLLDQAALAIENAMLLDRLQTQLEEVRALKQYNEGIIEASPAGIAVLDAEDKIVSANLAFAALARLDRPRLRGRSLLDVLPIGDALRPGDGLVDLTLPNSEGREMSLQISVGPFSGVGSISSGLRVLVANDVTERVAMEQALKEKDRLAALGVMAAGIAHEVNTPITGISSYAQMLLEATDDADPRYDLLQKVERQTFRASKIVNSLLSLARDKGVDGREVDLRALLEESIEVVAERAERSDVRTEVDICDGDLTMLVSDGQLQQVFTNLFQNAIEAMEPDGGVLKTNVVADAEWVQVDVIDSGPGIARSERGRVFEPFYSTKVSSGGTGLGLSISHEIVRRHGGELSLVEEAPGGHFRVRLPRNPEST